MNKIARYASENFAKASIGNVLAANTIVTKFVAD